MLIGMEVKDYISRVEKFYAGKPEVDLILVAMFFEINLKVLYVEDEVIKKTSFKFGEKEIAVYINPEGYFDIVCAKNFIKKCGLCQSIVLDVNLEVTVAN
jgi:hypothetical protein